MLTRTVRVRLILIAVPPVAVFHFLNYSAMVSITAGWLNFGLLPFNGLHFTFVGYKSGQAETDKTEGEKKKEKGSRKNKIQTSSNYEKLLVASTPTGNQKKESLRWLFPRRF